MTQPNDPTEALPIPRRTQDAAETARLDVHRPQPPAEPTAHLPSGDATVHLAAGEPTARLIRQEANAAPGEATAHLAHGEPTMPQRALGGATGTWPAARPAPREQTVGSATGAGHGIGTGRATGPGPGTLFGGPTGAAAPSGGEMRFGPGVPTTPPPAPAWPTPPRRRRSAWRTVTSVLSALLTVVLLAAVGLYLWQRISPLEVTGVSVAVPQPAGDRCDATVDVVATVSTNGRAGKIRYQWLRTGSAPGSLLTERVGRGQRTVALTLRWTFSGVGTTTETATVNITSPAPVQAQTPVSYDCRRS
ncbi:hypothetical protein V6U77_16040 [Micromonospora sp. CPCC 205546]|uniref:hypothetical protein n=1 Tax=Micromonospora sp. CPCC 205546 TaxID=3122397 RepID=UPI002FF1C06A